MFLVKDYLKDLTELNSQNKLTLAQIPGYEKYQGNEKGDELAQEDSDKELLGYRARHPSNNRCKKIL